MTLVGGRGSPSGPAASAMRAKRAARRRSVGKNSLESYLTDVLQGFAQPPAAERVASHGRPAKERAETGTKKGEKPQSVRCCFPGLCTPEKASCSPLRLHDTCAGGGSFSTPSAPAPGSTLAPCALRPPVEDSAPHAGLELPVD